MCPIPAFRVARTALLLASKAFGFLQPYLRVLDVNTVLLFPQKGQFTVNVLASPLLVSSGTLRYDDYGLKTTDGTKIQTGRRMSDVTSRCRKLTTVRSSLVCRSEITVRTNS